MKNLKFLILSELMTDGKVDAVTFGSGTGGTMAGIYLLDK